jgi:hypothetical protein
MTSAPDDFDDDGLPDDLDDLLDDVPSQAQSTKKGRAIPLRRPPEVVAAQEKAVELDDAKDGAQRLAQVVNLMIAGHSLADIGASTGMSEAEMDRMLNADMTRYVRNQPALRTYVRNYLSSKYTSLLDAVWDDATNKTSKVRFEAQDRAVRVLKRLEDLHGAAAPTQTEIKIETTPESVEAVIKALAAGQGLDYDDGIFDTVPGTVVHSAAADATNQLAVSGNAVEKSDGNDAF